MNDKKTSTEGTGVPWCKRCQCWHRETSPHIHESTEAYLARIHEMAQPRPRISLSAVIIIGAIVLAMIKFAVDEYKDATYPTWPNCDAHPALHLNGRDYDCEHMPDGTLNLIGPRPHG